MNAMAGGGTILTFPTLLLAGLPAIAANATSTVALLPGSLASLYGFRDEVRRSPGWLRTLFFPSLIGGTLGSILLLRTPEKVFAALAPLLILFATILFMVPGGLSSRSPLLGPGAPPPPLPPAHRERSRRPLPGAAGGRLAPAIRRRRLRRLLR